MDDKEREDLIQKLTTMGWNKRKALDELGIPESTYYHWKKNYDEKGLEGLKKQKTAAGRIWNRLLDDEKQEILKIARAQPEKSARLLSVEITDNHSFSVSESSVYQILKKENLIEPRPLEEMPAGRQWHHKTTRVDEIWQCDATHVFVAGWGYYKIIPVLDDHSRIVLSCDVHDDESSYSISDAVEMAREEAKRLGHKLDPPPTLLSDNGAGFKGAVLEGYLSMNGIRHIYGKPYHPQTQGKVERFNRTIKQRTTYLMVYCSPEELRQAVKKAVDEYNARPHESLSNVCPNDVYAGRKEEILQKRAEKKRLTLERRKTYNLARKNG
jgi:putative transposase